MIKLQKSNVVKIVSSKEASEKLIAKGFAIVEPAKGTTKTNSSKTPKTTNPSNADGNDSQKDGDGNGSDKPTNPPEASGGTQTEPQA